MATASGQLQSVRGLAAGVGRSHVAVARWVKRDDWPFGAGPWSAGQIPAIQAWAARTLAEDPAKTPGGEGETTSLKDLSPLKKIDAALKLARKSRVDFDLDVDRGIYHRVDDCRRRRLQQIHEIKTGLLNLADGLPFDAEAKAIVRGRVLELLRKWSSPDPANASPDPHAPVNAAAG